MPHSSSSYGTVDAFLDDVLGGGGPAAANSLSLAEFTRHIYPAYVQTRYHTAIDEHLEQVMTYVATGGARGIKQLAISIPPRHGKSLKVSRLFPAWLLGEHPDLRLIATSYAAALAKRNSRFVRNLIDSAKYSAVYPHVALAADTASALEWDTTAGGGMIAAGVGGGVTGHGANLLLVDDPIKSRAEAESETYRQRLKDWYNDDLLTRLEEPGGAIVVIGTRWHADDLIGYLLEDETDDWTVLRLPALAEADDPLGREVGEALWPERYGVDVLAKRRARMGEYAFAGLYQQRPLPSGGGLFDTAKIEVVEYPPAVERAVRFYDLAVTKKSTSDYTAGVKLGRATDGRIVVMDVCRVRQELPDLHETIVQNALIDGPDVPIRLEAEKAGVIELAFLLRDRRLSNYRIDAVPPQGDKYTRAGPFASRVNGGQVLMQRGMWNRAFLDELAVFPAGAHDDQVDALSGAYGMLDRAGPFILFGD